MPFRAKYHVIVHVNESLGGTLVMLTATEFNTVFPKPKSLSLYIKVVYVLTHL